MTVRENPNVPETPSHGVSGKCPDASSGGQNPDDGEPGPREKIAEGALLLVEAAKAFERRDFVAGAVLTALSADAMCDGCEALGLPVDDGAFHERTKAAPRNRPSIPTVHGWRAHNGPADVRRDGPDAHAISARCPRAV